MFNRLKSALSRLPTELKIALGLIASVLSTVGAMYATYLNSDKYYFDQDALAIQLSVDLEKGWEANFSAENRLRFVRFIAAINQAAPDVRKRLELAIIRDEYLYNPAEIKRDKIVMGLLDLKSDASNDAIIKELNKYRTAVFQSLNAMESISIISYSFGRSKTTRQIVDLQYRGIIEKRREELREFICLYNEEMHHKRGSDYNAWIALYLAFPKNANPTASLCDS